MVYIFNAPKLSFAVVSFIYFINHLNNKNISSTNEGNTYLKYLKTKINIKILSRCYCRGKEASFSTSTTRCLIGFS